mmetsp:Transcript_12999/g.29499  ORF Transcript_12999/g.29499 Transcript_12999/m.29499 type:complete len:489 (+) Transcript_12999:52-1518(+)
MAETTLRALRLYSKRVLLPDWSIVPAIISICGETIVSVDVVESVPAGTADLVDLGSRVVTPAFINAHTHLPMVAMRGIEGCAKAMTGDVVKDLYFQIEKQLSPDDVRAFARLGCYESITSGVGLVWEHYYHGMALAEALSETGLAGVVCPTLQDLSGPGVPWLEAAFEDTRTIATDADMAKRGVFAALGPHATDTVSDLLWQRIVKEAQALGGLPVHSHFGQGIAEFETASKDGYTPVEKLAANGVLSSGLPLMLVHGQFVTAKDVELLDRTKHVLCICPRSHMLFAFPTAARRWQAEQVPIALATDAAASNDDMNVQLELRVLSGLPSFEATSSSEAEELWKAKGQEETLKAARALHARRQAAHESREAQELRDHKRLLQTVWQTPGKLHPRFRAGVIESGALANLLIWDMDHPCLWPGVDIVHSLVMCDATKGIDGMLVCGKWLGRPPEAAGADARWVESIRSSTKYLDSLSEATERFQALLSRLS